MAQRSAAGCDGFRIGCFMTAPLYLSPKEAAAFLRIDVQAIYDAIAAQELEAFNLSRAGSAAKRPRWRLTPAALDSWVASRSTIARRQPPPAPSRAARRPSVTPPAIVGPRRSVRHPRTP